VLAQATPAAALLVCAEVTLREKFRTGEDAFGFGAVLDLILEIDRALTPLLESHMFADDITEQRALLGRIAGGEVRFITWNIIRALALVEGADTGALQELPGVEKEGRDVVQTLKPPLERMRAWFGLRAGGLKLPVLGDM
jgi:hypothetical protein